ncbi:hypothetical protein AB9F26_13475 [Falsihalocynthiibacter sp. BN13B15]|uniref:hypothetical protein n=1 Tax=Falsihalocynthiibacter sp. BN13B15 TaxID=3240871 RepID=UPI00350EB37B
MKKQIVLPFLLFTQLASCGPQPVSTFKAPEAEGQSPQCQKLIAEYFAGGEIKTDEMIAICRSTAPSKDAAEKVCSLTRSLFYGGASYLTRYQVVQACSHGWEADKNW